MQRVMVYVDGFNLYYGLRPSSPSEKHGWRVFGGMMGPVQ